MAYCTKCGAKLDETNEFCTSCGKHVKNNTHEIEIKDKEEDKHESSIQKNKLNDTTQLKEEKISQHMTNNKSKKAGKIFIFVIIILLFSISIIFYKQIIGCYYLVRYKTESNLEKKLEFIGESLKNLKIDTTAETFKSTALQLIYEDKPDVENIIHHYKDSIEDEVFKELSMTLYNQKVLTYVENREFDDAFTCLVEISENGGDIRNNEMYENIMLNTISELTNLPVYDTKEALYKNSNIYFDNLDNDTYDEIIELKSSRNENGSSYVSSLFKLNLYKVKNGIYQKVYSENLGEVIGAEIFGIYAYESDKRGLYLSLIHGNHYQSASIYKIKNNSFVSIGTVAATYGCSAEDIDNDGIYEISASEKNDPNNMYSNADAPTITKWYKFKDDGNNTPDIIKTKYNNAVSSPSKQSNVSTNRDFLFTDSDKRYLTSVELSMLSKEELSLARNEIFARYGYIFKTERLAQYFSSKSWYLPNPNYDGSQYILNDFEKYNCELIKEWEKLY